MLQHELPPPKKAPIITSSCYMSPYPPASYPRMPPASLGTLIDKTCVAMDKMSVPMDKEFVLHRQQPRTFFVQK